MLYGSKWRGDPSWEMRNTTLLQGLTIRYGLQTAQQYTLHIVHIESDDKGIVDSIKGVTVPSVYCNIIVNNINELMGEVDRALTKNIPRQDN